MATAVVAFCAAVAACYFAAPVVLPAVVALLVAAVVAPGVRLLRRSGVPAAASALLAVFLAVGVVLACGYGVGMALAGVVEDVPQYATKIRRAASVLEKRLGYIQRTTTSMVPRQPPPDGEEKPVPVVERQHRDLGGLLLRGLGSVFEAGGIALFVPFLALFLLLEDERLERAFDRAAGKDFDGPRFRREAGAMARAYVFGNLVLGVAIASLQAALFLWLGLQNAVGLGLVSGFLNTVPVLGLPAALALPVIQGLGSFHEAWPFGVIVIGLTVIHLIAANWVVPRSIGVRVRLNGTAGTVGMLFFGWLWGVVGFLLAIPLTAAVRIALECAPGGERLAALLASDGPGKMP